MRALSFAGVRVQWGPFNLTPDIVRGPRVVRWSGGLPRREARDSGMGFYVPIRHPPDVGTVVVEIVRDSKTHLRLRRLAQRSDLASTLPFPMVIRDTITSETITLLAAQFERVPQQHKGSGVGAIPMAWKFEREVSVVTDLDAAQVGS